MNSASSRRKWCTLRELTAERVWDRSISLRGVGPKTAACVLLFSLDQPYFPMDTHVHRVARRLAWPPRGAHHR